MNEQIKRRTNPFDNPIITEEESKVEREEEIVTKPIEQAPQMMQQPVYNEPVQQYQYQQTQQRQPRRQQRPQYIQPVETQKDKYTATMDVSLRRKIKVYCAQNGRMFSEFVEEACREKLSREGVK